ncbi:MAG: MaoC/PaaZ C-terminal domain-containing protein [Acidimicrobiales bacterium]
MALSASNVSVGQTFEQVLVEDLKRTQLVMYAGSSGDYNPLHSDEPFATQVAGYPSVFAHGMLTMGMTGRVLTDALGDGRLLAYGGRFTSQVFPGDNLKGVATITSIDTVDGVPVATFSISTTNQDGVEVFSGEARGRLDP